MNALGLVEVVGFSTAVYVADSMVKTADITISRLERTKGAGWMTIYVNGDVGAVQAAVSDGQAMAEAADKFVTAKVIARPTDELGKFITKKSATKVAPKIESKTTKTESKSSKNKK